MLLPSINIKSKINKNSLYFGCDSSYFNLYGKSLVNSLKHFAPWTNVHVHLFNPSDLDLQWCETASITYSYEKISPELREIKTYYACVRFIRIPEIFVEGTRVISIDCDGIVIKEISQEKFLKDTEISAVLWREKNKSSLASSIFFGPDDFRNIFAARLLPFFTNDNYNWFLDQDILDELINEGLVNIVTLRDWGNPKVGKDTLIWTVKGERKNNPEFQNLVNIFKKG